MSVKDSIETGWTKLPADCAPIAGKAIAKLFALEGPFFSNVGRELMIDGWIQRDPPVWIIDRRADWWLVDDQDNLTVPLVWSGGELVGTTVVYKERETSERTARERRLIAGHQTHLHRQGVV